MITTAWCNLSLRLHLGKHHQTPHNPTRFVPQFPDTFPEWSLETPKVLVLFNQFNRIPEKNSTVSPLTVTNHLCCFWNTFSPGNPCLERIAFRRDFVVTDCQPPSNSWTKLSPTTAILLPCRRTTDEPVSESKCTEVFACCQLQPFEMALFISASILRIKCHELIWLL